MIILSVHKSRQPGGLDVQALIGTAEFKQLGGHLFDLCLFSRSTITEPASVIKTGARHSYTKYVQFPVKLRRQYKTDAYDFNALRCGVIRYRESLFIIYHVPERGLVPPHEETSPEWNEITTQDATAASLALRRSRALSSPRKRMRLAKALPGILAPGSLLRLVRQR